MVWMVADVVNTNQLGGDGPGVRVRLDAGDGVGRMLAAKSLALDRHLCPTSPGPVRAGTSGTS